MRLIDADYLLNVILVHNFHGNNKDYVPYSGRRGYRQRDREVREAIINAPTVEREKGEWIPITQPWADTQIFRCTCCGRHIEVPQYEVNTLTLRFPFCHCGANMRGENE